MQIRLINLRAAWLLVTALVAGCAVSAGPEHPASAGSRSVDAPRRKAAMIDDDVHDRAAVPAADRRRRADVVLARDPDDLGARLIRMQADVDLGDFEAALADSEAALAHPTLDRHVRLWVLDLRAESLIQARREPEAILAADEALAIDGSDPEALFARGWARYLSDHALAQDALADLDRGLQLEPDQGIAHYRRAVIFKDQGKFDLATAELERALQLVPDDGPSHEQYGVLMFAEWYSGQFRQSIEAFREQAARPDASSYAPLWLFIMRIRTNPADEAAARAELVTLAPAQQPHEWRQTLVDLMLGKATFEAALVEADAAPTDRLRAGQRCEADYYVAEQLLAHGQDLRASGLLDEAQAVCPSTYIEVKAIAAARRLLAASAPAR